MAQKQINSTYQRDRLGKEKTELQWKIETGTGSLPSAAFNSSFFGRDKDTRGRHLWHEMHTWHRSEIFVCEDSRYFSFEIHFSCLFTINAPSVDASILNFRPQHRHTRCWNRFMEETSSERLLTTQSKNSTAERCRCINNPKTQRYVSQPVFVRTPSD